MRRFACIAIVTLLSFGSVAAAAAPAGFTILGASVNVRVTRGARTLPASFVPSLRKGDTIDISFPRGVQFSTSPRWHLVVADLYQDYLKQPPTFPIADADLSRLPPGHVWRVRYDGKATPIVFLVPEDGSTRGRGIPDARAAIAALANRSLLLRTAALSADAAVKRSTMDRFLASLTKIRPAALGDAHARIAAATKSLFGADLTNASCFDSSLAQSTQYACAAQAIAGTYDAGGRVDVTSAVGSQLAANTATYGMLMGTLYELLAKRHVAADYTFVPGVIHPGDKNTNVYVSEQPSYDASANNPSTIVYFEIGSGTARAHPAYGAPATQPVCTDGSTLAFTLPFDGSPVYFRSHELAIGRVHPAIVPLTYDPLEGFTATLPQAALHGTLSVLVRSRWGFDHIVSPAISVVSPHAASWSLVDPHAVAVVTGAEDATLRFTDAGAGVGTCVQSVTLTDGLGNALPVASVTTSGNIVTVRLHAPNAGGATGSAVLHEADGIDSASVPFAIYPAMPVVTSATFYLPEGRLILKGTNLKYIATVTLDGHGIVFGNGSENDDGSWAFTTASPAAYHEQWTHETMTATLTMQSPDPRTTTFAADVLYAPAISPNG